MKKLLSLFLILYVMIPISAFALNYKLHLPNDATFETMEEAHANGSAWLAKVTGRPYAPDPAMDSYPVGTSWVYRAPGTYTCMTAALRMNTNFLVYTDKSFASKNDAYAYIKDMGLVDTVNACYGSIVLVTPIDKKAGFGDADQYAFYQLQSAMCNLTYAAGTRGKPDFAYYADNSYYGGLTYRYAIGIGGGANFLNDYVASTLDYVSRMAGMLLINGKMDAVREVASPVPVYLVNPGDGVVEKYKAGNRTDASGYEGDAQIYFNQQLPLRKVCVEQIKNIDLKALVSKVYEGLFVKTFRNAVANPALYTPGTPYRNYNWNKAPYSLGARVPFYTGKTAGGLCVTEHFEERFADIKTTTGEYLQTWFEVLPQEVLDGTAVKASIPLILAIHGGGDDALQFVDETGLLPIAEKERIAIVAPNNSVLAVDNVAMPALVRYMLAAYPALDPSRVYVTGYSTGGMGTCAATYGAPELFAASVPMAAGNPPSATMPTGKYDPTDAQVANIAKYDMPIMIMCSTYEGFFDRNVGGLDARYQTYLNTFLSGNHMDPITFDFATYPRSGFKADRYSRTVLNGEYVANNWVLNKNGIPMLSLNITEGLPHGLYQEYGVLGWNFMKHYARDPKTGKLRYNVNGF